VGTLAYRNALLSPAFALLKYNQYAMPLSICKIADSLISSSDSCPYLIERTHGNRSANYAYLTRCQIEREVKRRNETGSTDRSERVSPIYMDSLIVPSYLGNIQRLHFTVIAYSEFLRRRLRMYQFRRRLRPSASLIGCRAF